MFKELEIERLSGESGQTLGSGFEKAVRDWINGELLRLAPDRGWLIGAEKITAFVQYGHLGSS